MIKRLIKIVLVMVFVALLALAVMLLWNNIIPSVIGWNTLTYPQALGLLVLSRILLGGGALSRFTRADQLKIKAQVKGMTKEEKREYIKAYMRHEQS